MKLSLIDQLGLANGKTDQTSQTSETGVTEGRTDGHRERQASRVASDTKNLSFNLELETDLNDLKNVFMDNDLNHKHIPG